MRSSFQAFLPLALSSLLVLACDGGGDESNTGSDAPPFPEGQGQDPAQGVEYAPGPYGIEVGSVIANYKFVGYPSPDTDKKTPLEIQLADFYNPTGDGVYPEGSPMGAGNAKPKALMISVASVWCGPCNYESDSVLPGEYAHYNPMGVEFLLNLADGPDVGIPAKLTHLKSWTTQYDTKWPAVIDPSYKLAALFTQDAYPANFIVDTKTMKILSAIAGVPIDANGNPLPEFYDPLDDLLAGG